MKQLSSLSAFLILFFCSIACWAEETPADNSDQAPTTEQTKSNDQSKDKQTDESEEEEEPDCD